MSQNNGNIQKINNLECMFKEFYLVIKNGQIYKCATLEDVSFLFKWVISDKGNVTVDGKEYSVTYNMEEWKREAIIKDFIRSGYIEKTLSGVEIYRAQKL